MEKIEKQRKFEIIVMAKPEDFEVHESEILKKVCKGALSRPGFFRSSLEPLFSALSQVGEHHS